MGESLKHLLHVCLRFMNVDQLENGEKEDCAEKVGNIIEDLGQGAPKVWEAKRADV